jgi:hypothetical protein
MDADDITLLITVVKAVKAIAIAIITLFGRGQHGHHS